MPEFNYDFSGKTVWVTGAGSGIGAKIAADFGRLKAKVIAIDKTFKQLTPNTLANVALDLTDLNAVANQVQQLIAQYKQVDILVNAAGVLVSGGIFSLTSQDWDRCLATNTSAIFYLAQQLAPVFKQQRHGSIVSIASNAAHVPRLGMLAYCTSKAATRALTNCLGLELAPFNVRCNTVSPGSTDTPMLRAMLPQPDYAANLVAGMPEQYKLGIPLAKIAQPQDIANAVLFLASDLASHITMQDVVVDGGATLAA